MVQAQAGAEASAEAEAQPEGVQPASGASEVGEAAQVRHRRTSLSPTVT